jgi:hypothetical protein
VSPLPPARVRPLLVLLLLLLLFQRFRVSEQQQSGCRGYRGCCRRHRRRCVRCGGYALL